MPGRSDSLEDGETGRQLGLGGGSKVWGASLSSVFVRPIVSSGEESGVSMEEEERACSIDLRTGAPCPVWASVGEVVKRQRMAATQIRHGLQVRGVVGSRGRNEEAEGGKEGGTRNCRFTLHSL